MRKLILLLPVLIYRKNGNNYKINVGEIGKGFYK